MTCDLVLPLLQLPLLSRADSRKTCQIASIAYFLITEMMPITAENSINMQKSLKTKTKASND